MIVTASDVEVQLDAVKVSSWLVEDAESSADSGDSSGSEMSVSTTATASTWATR